MKKQQIIIENQEQERKWRRSKAFLVAHANKLSTSYVIEIHNQGEGPARDVKTLINDKLISESPLIATVQDNISHIAPKDWITYMIKPIPPAGIKVNISWTDASGELGQYENRLIMY